MDVIKLKEKKNGIIERMYQSLIIDQNGIQILRSLNQDDLIQREYVREFSARSGSVKNIFNR